MLRLKSGAVTTATWAHSNRGSRNRVFDGDAAFLGARRNDAQRRGHRFFQSFRRASTIRGPYKASESAGDWGSGGRGRPSRSSGVQLPQDGRGEILRNGSIACDCDSTKNWSTRSLSMLPERARARWTPSHRIDRDSCTRWSMDVSRIRKRIRLLVGSATLADAAVLYRGNNADDSAVDSLRRITGGLRVSPNIAAASGNKQDALVRKGLRDDVHVGCGRASRSSMIN